MPRIRLAMAKPNRGVVRSRTSFGVVEISSIIQSLWSGFVSANFQVGSMPLTAALSVRYHRLPTSTAGLHRHFRANPLEQSLSFSNSLGFFEAIALILDSNKAVVSGIQNDFEYSTIVDLGFVPRIVKVI